MQINAGQNFPLTSTNSTQVLPKSSEVDESLFVLQGDLPESVYNSNSEATVSVVPQTPEEAWQQYAFGTSGSMVNVASTIPAGYQDVSTQLDSMLAEQGIQAPAGMTIKFAIPEAEADTAESSKEVKEPVFIVENVNDEALTERIESLLNASESDRFKQSYLALDTLTASENTRLAQQRDNVLGLPVKASSAVDDDQNIDSLVTYGYQQDFAMGFDGQRWSMNATIQHVELMRLEKIAS